MSQQFHAWSHMKKSELPGFVVALQVRPDGGGGREGGRGSLSTVGGVVVGVLLCMIGCRCVASTGLC